MQVGGETVVDLWAGVADLEGEQPWNHDTLVNTYCCIKPFTAIAALMLVEEGKLELDQTVAHYWPEFSQGGKERITLRQVLCHTSGIPALRLPSRTPIMYDWDAMAEVVAAQKRERVAPRHRFGNYIDGDRHFASASCQTIRRVVKSAITGQAECSATAAGTDIVFRGKASAAASVAAVASAGRRTWPGATIVATPSPRSASRSRPIPYRA